MLGQRRVYLQRAGYRGRLRGGHCPFPKGLELRPDFADAYVNLGNALDGHGRHQGAIEHFRKVPDVAIAHNDRVAADAIRARIRLHQSVAPVGNPT